jgi:hypothetical protein
MLFSSWQISNAEQDVLRKLGQSYTNLALVGITCSGQLAASLLGHRLFPATLFWALVGIISQSPYKCWTSSLVMFFLRRIIVFFGSKRIYGILVSLKTVAMKEEMQPQSLMKLPFYKNTSLVVLVDDCIYRHN